MLRLDAYDLEYLRALDRLAPTTDDTVTISRLAQELRWSKEVTVDRTWRLFEQRLIDTDAGLGCDPTEIYGRRRP